MGMFTKLYVQSTYEYMQKSAFIMQNSNRISDKNILNLHIYQKMIKIERSPFNPGLERDSSI